MSETQQAGSAPATPTEEVAPAAPKKKVFSKSDVKRFVEASVILPSLYPDFEPWVFKLRLKLSSEADKRRQEYLSLSASKRAVKANDQVLDEICDLLLELPSGFDDLKDNGQGPGASWRAYVETTTDPIARQLLDIVTEGADSLYWNSILPREFRSEV